MQPSADINSSPLSGKMSGDKPLKYEDAPCFRLPDAAHSSTMTPADEAVLLGAQKYYHHTTWAHTESCDPQLLFHPETTEQVQSIAWLAQLKQKKITTFGVAHSPSDLTCTTDWIVNLQHLNGILDLKKLQSHGDEGSFGKARVLVQSGISLRTFGEKLAALGHMMPTIGSIDSPSLAGVIGTASHGSSLKHGLLSENVRGLRIVVADGRALWCSPYENQDLFRAALVSLGAVGIITEIEYEVVPACNIEWEQTLMSLEVFLGQWEKIWTTAEFVRCWWFPYQKRLVVWSANKTHKPLQNPNPTWYERLYGLYWHRLLLMISNYLPIIVPLVEWLVCGTQFRFTPGFVSSGVSEQRLGLLKECAIWQYVNEWAIPVQNGPVAVSKFSEWLHGKVTPPIPYTSANLWVHFPLEIRIAPPRNLSARPFLDPRVTNGPTCYINLPLFRPYGVDPPSRRRCYEAFEAVMRNLGGKPHWAKNFTISQPEFKNMYNKGLEHYLDIRQRFDPKSMFIGDWHRRNILAK